MPEKLKVKKHKPSELKINSVFTKGSPGLNLTPSGRRVNTRASDPRCACIGEERSQRGWVYPQMYSFEKKKNILILLNFLSYWKLRARIYIGTLQDLIAGRKKLYSIDCLNFFTHSRAWYYKKCETYKSISNNNLLKHFPQKLSKQSSYKLLFLKK